MPGSLKVYRARYIVPIDRPPIHDGYVMVEENTIVEIGPWNSKDVASPVTSNSLVDLGDVAIIPALVNAHTHLEFSHLRQPLGEPGIEFTDWIRKVVATRNQQNHTGSPISKSSSVLRGLAESYRSGVGCLGEIATNPVSEANYRCPSGRPGVEISVFYEQLGRNPDLLPLRQSELSQFLSDFSSHDAKDVEGAVLSPAISPHAPYSVHPKLLNQMIDVAIANDLPVAMHLAETEAERDLLSNRQGPFVDLLKDFGIWDPSSFLPTQSIADVLENLSRCARVLIVHGNYLENAEIELIAKHRERMSVVYCPRTHEFFGHAAYPLEKLRKEGVLVALGTDSRASNPDLNLFSELQAVAQKFPGLSPSTILELGTINGATALGKSARLGSLSVGKLARMSLLEHPDSSAANLEWLLDPQTKCRPLI